jgi:hypothetical protein
MINNTILSHKCSSSGSYEKYYWRGRCLNLIFHISPHLNVWVATRLLKCLSILLWIEKDMLNKIYYDNLINNFDK